MNNRNINITNNSKQTREIEYQENVKNAKIKSIKNPINAKIGNYTISSIPVISRDGKSNLVETSTLYLINEEMGPVKVCEIVSGDTNNYTSNEQVREANNNLEQIKRAVTYINLNQGDETAKTVENALQNSMKTGNFEALNINNLVGAKMVKKTDKALKTLEQHNYNNLFDIQTRYLLNRENLEEKTKNDTLEEYDEF